MFEHHYKPHRHRRVSRRTKLLVHGGLILLFALSIFHEGAGHADMAALALAVATEVV